MLYVKPKKPDFDLLSVCLTALMHFLLNEIPLETRHDSLRPIISIVGILFPFVLYVCLVIPQFGHTCSKYFRFFVKKKEEICLLLLQNLLLID